MNRWLRDNPIGLGLAALCGVLLLTMVALGIVSMLPVDSVPGGEDDAAGDQALTLPELGESPPIDAYYVITERPLFHETRQPLLEGDLGFDPLAEALQDADGEAPDVELSGVIITPSLRMAMLRRKDEDRSIVAMEGWPIEGEFSAWQLSRVDPREVLLTSGAGEELLLKLKVHDEKIAPPARPAAKKAQAEADSATAAKQQEEGQPLSRAEEIRQRIAERREELRQQAETEEQAGEEAEQPSYQQAIQSMIGRNRRNNGNDREEQ
jgi:hypothetical protein